MRLSLKFDLKGNIPFVTQTLLVTFNNNLHLQNNRLCKIRQHGSFIYTVYDTHCEKLGYL